MPPIICNDINEQFCSFDEEGNYIYKQKGLCKTENHVNLFLIDVYGSKCCSTAGKEIQRIQALNILGKSSTTRD